MPMFVEDERYICAAALKLAKRSLKYNELQRILGIPAPVIWRYIAGVVRPTRERASEILRILVEKGVIRGVIAESLKFVDGNVVNLYNIVYKPEILWLASVEAYYHFRNAEADAALTTEVDGIPVALATSMILGLDLVVAKRRKEVGFSEFYEETYLSRDPPSLVTLYVPKESLKRGSRVIIVDDMLRSGRTLKALTSIARQARAEVVGIFSLVSVGSEWRSALKEIGLEHVKTVILYSR